MKFLRVGSPGHEKPAVLDGNGIARDISSVAADISPESIADGLAEKIAAADIASLPALDENERIGAPLSQTGHFVAIGLNYADHAEESGMPIPEEPIVFSKAPSCLSGPNDDVTLMRGSVKSDWECELAIIIGKTAEYVSEDDALDYVFGYAVCNDVSEREFQIERGGQWIKGKSAPGYGPLGPWIVTSDEVGDPQNLGMFLNVNGERAQTGNTSTMIFGVAHIVSYLSQFMRLEAGDIITTGTPAGVGMGMKPQRYLKAGDEMHLGIEGLGEQRQKVLAPTPA